MKTIPKLVIITTILFETIASADMCMYYIKEATKNTELATLSMERKKVSSAISHFEQSQEYLIKAKYACPSALKDSLQANLKGIQTNINDLKNLK